MVQLDSSVVVIDADRVTALLTKEPQHNYSAADAIVCGLVFKLFVVDSSTGYHSVVTVTTGRGAHIAGFEVSLKGRETVTEITGRNLFLRLLDSAMHNVGQLETQLKNLSDTQAPL